MIYLIDGDHSLLEGKYPYRKVQGTPQLQQLEVASGDIAVIYEQSLSLMIDLLKVGFEHILGPNLEVIEQTLRHSVHEQIGDQAFTGSITHLSDIDKRIEDALLSLNTEGYFEDPRDFMRLICNEMATNAYHSKPDRKQDSAIVLETFNGESQMTARVTDNWGTLSRSKIIASLDRANQAKAPRQDTRGAGLGMYMMYQHASVINVTIHTNKQCQISCTINKMRRYKDYRSQTKSFHLREYL